MLNTKVNLASHPSVVGKSSVGLSGCGWVGRVHPCRAAGNTDFIWQVTFRSFESGFPLKAIPFKLLNAA